MRIGFATNDFSRTLRTLGGAGWYRCGLPARALAAHGIDTAVGTPVHHKYGRLGLCPLELIDAPDDVRAAAHDFDFDVIVLQRGMWPGLETAIRYAKAKGQVIVNDVDDHFDQIPTTNQAFLSTLPGASMGDLDSYRRVLAASDLITCSTPFLERWYRRYAPTVTVRNAIDLDRWHPIPSRGPVQVGWIGVTSHRSRDLEVLRPWLTDWLADAGDTTGTFYHGGMTDRTAALDALGLPLSRYTGDAMVGIGEYPTLFLNLDVGVVPLSSVPFNRAKSAIKGMEYAAAGIPFVASPLDEYRWLRDECGIGVLAADEDDWRDELDRLVVSEDYRTETALRQREAVSALDIAHRWERWAEVLTNVKRRPNLSRSDRRRRSAGV